MNLIHSKLGFFKEKLLKKLTYWKKKNLKLFTWTVPMNWIVHCFKWTVQFTRTVHVNRHVNCTVHWNTVWRKAAWSCFGKIVFQTWIIVGLTKNKLYFLGNQTLVLLWLLQTQKQPRKQTVVVVACVAYVNSFLFFV